MKELIGMEMRKKVQPAIVSKLEEFSIFGYNRVKEEDIWNFLIHKTWRKRKEELKTFEVVNDIMRLKVGDFMNYATVEAFKLPEFSFDDEEERKALLR